MTIVPARKNRLILATTQRFARTGTGRSLANIPCCLHPQHGCFQERNRCGHFSLLSATNGQAVLATPPMPQRCLRTRQGHLCPSARRSMAAWPLGRLAAWPLGDVLSKAFDLHIPMKLLQQFVQLWNAYQQAIK